jgi:hypothetical protein
VRVSPPSSDWPVAALYVKARGVYFQLHNVDPWDEARDARRYGGPWPVVAHPPCERWGRYWWGGPSSPIRYECIGEDGGLFAHAITAVRQWGGVLEHPADTHAWRAAGVRAPPRAGRWVEALDGHPLAWTCCVEQGAYGHRAQKATWLYYVGQRPPYELRWGESESRLPPQRGAEKRNRGERSPNDAIERMCKQERLRTPPEFAAELVRLARWSTG